MRKGTWQRSLKRRPCEGRVTEWLVIDEVIVKGATACPQKETAGQRPRRRSRLAQLGWSEADYRCFRTFSAVDTSKFGLGTRSQRYAMIVDNGVIKDLFVEKPGAFEVSTAENVLKHL